MAASASPDFSFVDQDGLRFRAFFVVVCLGLLYLPTGFEERQPTNSLHSKARVISVDKAHLHSNLIIKSGSQVPNVQILEGPYAGSTESVFNNVMGKMDLDETVAHSGIELALGEQAEETQLAVLPLLL